MLDFGRVKLKRPGSVSGDRCFSAYKALASASSDGQLRIWSRNSWELGGPRKSGVEFFFLERGQNDERKWVSKEVFFGCFCKLLAVLCVCVLFLSCCV